MLALAETVTVVDMTTAPRTFSYGWPLDWLTQQSTLTPPPPYAFGVASPWENATSIRGRELAFDTAVVWASLILLVSLTQRRFENVRRRRIDV